MKVLVLGASLKTERYSNMAVRLLQDNKHEVFAIGNSEGFINRTQIVKGQNFNEKVHTISLYLNPSNQEQYYDFIVALRPERVIFNPGTENPELKKRLDENRINSEIACTLVLLRTNSFID